MTLLRKYLTLDNDVIYALVAHIGFVLLYLQNVHTNHLVFMTPFGPELAAVFSASLECMLIACIAKRLGFLQGLGVIATSYALAFAFEGSPNLSGTTPTALGKVAALAVAAAIYKWAVPKFKLRDRWALMLAFWTGQTASVMVFANMAHKQQIILPTIYVEGLLFAAVAVFVASLESRREDQWSKS